MKTWNAVFVGCAVVGSLMVGCSSTSDDAPSTPKLSGTYQATSAGAITEITFYDSAHYFLSRSPCADQEKCIESGSYAVNDAQTELALTNVDTGETKRMPFHAMNVNRDANLTGLRAESVNTLGGPLVGDDAGPLVPGDGGSIVGDGGSLIELIKALIEAFTAGDQSFSNGDNGDGGSGGNGGGGDNGGGGGDNGGGDNGDGKKTSQRVSLKYEGDCDFLHSCSTFSQNMPEGQVSWGCTGQAVCSDSDPWIAAPTKSYCGKKTATLCNGSGKCVVANIRDTSVSRDWEGGNAVMSALGLSHGVTNRTAGSCSGYGGGNVTVTY